MWSPETDIQFESSTLNSDNLSTVLKNYKIWKVNYYTVVKTDNKKKMWTRELNVQKTGTKILLAIFSKYI